MTRLFTLCLSILCSNVALGALHIRDLDGDWSNGHEGVYDDALNITWLADWNFSVTSGYDIDADGRMTWSEAQTWADQLVIGGFTEWRLPNVAQPDNSCSLTDGFGADYGFNCVNSEMGSLWYSTLGGNADNVNQFGNPYDLYDNQNYQMYFENLQPAVYWFAEEFVHDTSRAWTFSLRRGSQGSTPKSEGSHTIAVHNGDIGSAVVPLPAATWLFLSALGSLFAASRKFS